MSGLINLTLPDGSVKQLKKGATGKDLALAIGERLARDAIGIVINGVVVDLNRPLVEDGTVRIITPKQDDADALDLMRHSAAHVMADAILRLWPNAKLVYGPTIKNGFYYDIELKEYQISAGDIPKIEAEMETIVQDDVPIERVEMNREDALEKVKGEGNPFKLDNLKRATGDVISFYRQGGFEDLCRGPHVPSTGRIGAFKIQSVAGSYWHGDVTGPVLQRIYGTAWPDKKSLKKYLNLLEEARRRDHRKLGKQLDWFHFQEDAPGEVFWHEKGWTLYTIIVDYMRSILRRNGYKEVKSPQILDRSLWEKSGHWEKFREAMFTTRVEDRDFAIKPMNCPGHLQIFNQKITSYRDLPLRMAEFGTCHRYEPGGTMHGLLRVREFVQDDGHIFCTEDQIQNEVLVFTTLLKRVYKVFGFENIIVYLATRPEKRVGDDAVWDKAEKALADALEAGGIEYGLHEGEGAFYGPKLEFSVPDALDRVWQLGTIQVDFSMPGRLGAEYVGEDNARHAPVMVHRAMLGSLERFIGILIEHYAGKFPVWLAPVQVRVASFTDRQADVVHRIHARLLEAGLRSEPDLRNEKVGYKVREFEMQKIPYLLVIGDKEVQDDRVAVRMRGKKNLGSMTLDDFIQRVKAENDDKVLA